MYHQHLFHSLFSVLYYFLPLHTKGQCWNCKLKRILHNVLISKWWSLCISVVRFQFLIFFNSYVFSQVSIPVLLFRWYCWFHFHSVHLDLSILSQFGYGYRAYSHYEWTKLEALSECLSLGHLWLSWDRGSYLGLKRDWPWWVDQAEVEPTAP